MKALITTALALVIASTAPLKADDADKASGIGAMLFYMSECTNSDVPPAMQAYVMAYITANVENFAVVRKATAKIDELIAETARVNNVSKSLVTRTWCTGVQPMLKKSIAKMNGTIQ